MSLGERLEGSGIGLRLVARGKGTVEEEEEDVERNGLHVGGEDVDDGGVQGVVDMLHVQH